MGIDEPGQQIAAGDVELGLRRGRHARREVRRDAAVPHREVEPDQARGFDQRAAAQHEVEGARVGADHRAV